MADLNKLAEEIVGLTLLQAQELKTILKDKYGIEPAAGGAVMMAGPAAGAAVVEEKTEFTVEVSEVPADSKIAVIKAVKNILNIGLTDAKAMVESAPFIVAKDIKKEDAEAMKTELSGAGATVNLK